jgi:molecular chaperone HtpG
VSDVRTTNRLTTSPACIVADEPDIEMNLMRRMRGSGMPSRPILEINPEHTLVRRLDGETDEQRLADWAHVLYNQSVLTLGARIDDPAEFVERLNGLLMTLADGTGEGAQETEKADTEAGSGEE